jgi:UDP-N-acetyl-D-mannosaminuronate dehydrogenase
LVAVRSTVVPGTTRGVIVPWLIKESGKEPGAAFGVAFNPEDEPMAAAIMSLYEELCGS